jgi:hypothetical protein
MKHLFYSIFMLLTVSKVTAQDEERLLKVNNTELNVRVIAKVHLSWLYMVGLD